MEQPYYNITPYEQPPAPRPSKHYLKYFLWSLGYYICATSFLTVLYFPYITAESFAPSEENLFYTIMHFIGLWIEILILPLMAGAFFWLVSGLRPRAGSWAFNIVMVLSLLLQVIGLMSPENPLVMKNMQQLNKIMNAYRGEASQHEQKWQQAYNAVNAPDILDFSRLNNKEEFARQKKIINHYIQGSNKYQNTFNNAIPNLEKSIRTLSFNNPLAQKTLQEATDTHNLRKPIFVPLIQAHIKYGNDLIQALDFLEQNQMKWTFTNNDIRFNDENALNKYRAIYQKIVADEATITELSNQLH